LPPKPVRQNHAPSRQRRYHIQIVKEPAPRMARSGLIIADWVGCRTAVFAPSPVREKDTEPCRRSLGEGGSAQLDEGVLQVGCCGSAVR